MSQVRIGFTNGNIISLEFPYFELIAIKEDFMNYMHGNGQNIRFYKYEAPSKGEFMANFSTITHIEVDN